MSVEINCVYPELAILKRDTHAASRWLVVDDDPMIVELISLILKDRALAEIRGFTAAAKAWDEVEGDPAAVELIITDRDMPGLDGLELARRIRLEAPQAKVILVTAHYDDLNPEELRQCGIAAVLPKPFSCEDLSLLVSTLLPQAMIQIAPPQSPRLFAAA